jgi:hypothetical protein
MLFTTIEAAPGLCRSDRRRVARSGPSAVLVRTGYASVLATAGFTSIEQRDMTHEYSATQRAWLDAMRRRAPAIGTAMGQVAFDERLADRLRALDAIDDGLLRRTEYLAGRPVTEDVSP